MPEQVTLLVLVTLSSSISAVLIQEWGKSKNPVYFFSKGLHDTETMYRPIKRATLVLVNAVTKLNPYFLSDVKRVLFDLSPKQVL